MTREPPISVVLGELRDLAGVGLRSEIEASSQFLVRAADVSSPRLAAAIADRQPDVAIVDGRALAYVREMRERQPGLGRTGVIVLVDRPAEAEGIAANGAGRVICLRKHLPVRAILAAVVLTAEGLRVSTVPERGRLGALTDRERQVYLLLCEGKSNAQIALVLHIGVETVKTHVRNVLSKFGASSRVELRENQ